MIPITALMIPITVIITTHLRKVAEIQYNRPATNSDEVAALRREVAELKEMVHTQMLALDVYAGGRTNVSTDDSLRNRL